MRRAVSAACKGADARIHADDQPHAVGRSALDHFVAHAVAFADAMRHMKVGRSAAKLDGGLQNDDRRGAVDVVVAVNQDFLFALDGRFQAVDGGAEAGHPLGKVKMVKDGERKRWADSGSVMPR